MNKLVAVYGDGVELENALDALEQAGLADRATVIGNGSHPRSTAVSLRWRSRGAGGDIDRFTERGVIVPPVVNGSAVPAAGPIMPAPPGVRAPAAVWEDGPATVGTGSALGTIDATRELERVTGAKSEEAGFYADVIQSGGSLLVIEGESSDLDSAEAALAAHGGQGMTRH